MNGRSRSVLKGSVAALAASLIPATSFGEASAAERDVKFAEAVIAKGETIAVWPEGKVPAQKGNSAWACGDTRYTVRLSDVDIPALQFFRAKGDSPCPAVVICPGGSYSLLAYTHEGTEIAEWLNGLGISAFVLRYRVPDQRDAAQMDAQRAMSLVRSRAAEFGVDPKRIGIMGFSAGANLAARTSTNFRNRAYAAVDGTDEATCRPDFSIVVYPWMLVCGDNAEKTLPLTLRGDFPVDATTPPTFLVQTEDDGAHVENALAYYTALKYAGVPAEMHIFPDGGHGYGMRPTTASVNGWQELLKTWLFRQLKMGLNLDKGGKK